MKPKTNIFSLFAAAALFIAANIATSFYAFNQLGKTAAARVQASSAIRHAGDLLSAVKDAETGQRGYIITGDASFLKPYLDVKYNITSQLRELRQFTGLESALHHLDALAPLISEKLVELELAIELRRNRGAITAIALVSRGKGRDLMDKIRVEIDGYVQIAEVAKAQIDVELQAKMRNVLIILATEAFITLAIGLLLAHLTNREKQVKTEGQEAQRRLEVQTTMNTALESLNANLQISEERLAVTLNSIGDAVMATDAHGIITILNPLAAQLTGWHQAEAKGRHVDEVFHVVHKDTNLPFIMSGSETVVLPAGAMLIHRDGTRRAIADSYAPILNREGNILGRVLVFRDITNEIALAAGQKSTRLQLANNKITQDAAREYAESIIDTVREPLIALDQDLRVVKANRSFYSVFKVIPQETMGKLIYDLGNQQWNIPKLRELLETILPQQTSFDNYEVEHDFDSIGKRIMLLNARQILRSHGKERIILLAIEDISVRKEIETGLKKAHEELTELASELKRATQAKSEFLANMSHELRTPLNSINGFSEVLFDETFGLLNEKQKKYVGNVLTSGKHLLQLINQILDMAKVESGKMHLSISRVHLKALLNEFSVLLADMISKKKIHLTLEIADDLPDIDADELKVKEIIYNLLSNAVKFTPEGGNIGMRAKQVGSQIEIVTWDSGIGIAAENLGKIFEGFFRVDTPYSRVSEGTGLGLPLSRKLVELHMGQFSVESEGLDRGTTVRFTLPIEVKVI